MHSRLSFLYDCDCDDCKTTKPQFINLAKGTFKQHLNDVEKAFKKLHATGSYKPEDLAKTKEYKKLINSTAAVFNQALTDNDIPGEMLNSLRNDVYMFSGLKTHAELFEASRLLLTDEGTVKPFSTFSKDVKAIKSDYNETYLEAEYQFALTSAQMAGKWAQVSNDYDLQYRTAFDDRVRESHKALHDITLPADDPFWLSYYPPNGWRCRCNAVQVRKGKYDISNSASALAAGEKATTQLGADGKNRLEIFRFNPGKQKVVFPPAHPYNKVQGAAQVKEILSDKDVEVINRNPAYKRHKAAYLELEKEFTINEDQGASIYMYTLPDGYYGHINKYHRTGKVSLGAKYDRFDSELMDAMTSVINTGLDNVPDRHTGKVYRGSTLPADSYEQYRKAFESKEPVIEKGFLSTTIDEHQAFNGEHFFVIETKDAARIKGISSLPHENEVLFKSGQQFKITDIKTVGDKEVFYMEQI